MNQSDFGSSILTLLQGYQFHLPRIGGLLSNIIYISLVVCSWYIKLHSLNIDTLTDVWNNH